MHSFSMTTAYELLSRQHNTTYTQSYIQPHLQEEQLTGLPGLCYLRQTKNR